MKKQNKQIKICIRCQKEILDDEHFIQLIEFDNEEEKKKNFFHFSCWEDKNLIKKLAMGLVARTHRIMDKAEGGTTEEVVIPPQ